MASQFHHAKPSTRSRRYSSRSATNDDGSLSKLSTADGDWTKAPIRRPGREGEREAGGLSLSEERRAPATARSLTRRPYAGLKGRSTFSLSLSLLWFSWVSINIVLIDQMRKIENTHDILDANFIKYMGGCMMQLVIFFPLWLVLEWKHSINSVVFSEKVLKQLGHVSLSRCSVSAPKNIGNYWIF